MPNKYQWEDTEVEVGLLWYRAECEGCTWSRPPQQQPVQNDCYEHIFATGHEITYGFETNNQMRLRKDKADA